MLTTKYGHRIANCPLCGRLLLKSNSDAPRGQINHRYRNEYRLSDDIETVSSSMTSLATKAPGAHQVLRRADPNPPRSPLSVIG